MNPDSAEKSISERRKRIIFQSRHRGTREPDLMIGNLVERVMPELYDDALDQLERLLDCTDADIWDWIVGCQSPPAAQDTLFIKRLREFRFVGSDDTDRRATRKSDVQ